MELQKLFCITMNKRTRQVSFHLKARVLKLEGLTPEQLWKKGNIDWPKPRVNVSKLK